MRGGGGGRGGGGAIGGMGGPGMKPRPLFIPHVPFDPVLAEPCFPPVRQVQQEQEVLGEIVVSIAIPASEGRDQRVHCLPFI